MKTIASVTDTRLLRHRAVKTLIKDLCGACGRSDLVLPQSELNDVSKFVVLMMIKHPRYLTLDYPALQATLFAAVNLSRSVYFFHCGIIADWLLKQNVRILLTVNLVSGAI